MMNESIFSGNEVHWIFGVLVLLLSGLLFLITQIKFNKALRVSETTVFWILLLLMVGVTLFYSA